MDERTLYLLALPILGFLLLLVRLVATVKGRPFSLVVKGFGVEMSVHTYGDAPRNRKDDNGKS